MADNFVQIRIKATDTAKPELDSLRADLDELGSKVDSAKVDVNDEDAKRKLLEINAELARLNKQVANPKIDTASAARAESRIEKLKGDFDDLIKKSDSAPSGGVLGKLLFGALGHLPGGGEGGSPLGMLGQLSGLSAGGGAIAAALGAVLVEVDGLVSGFAAAGAGAGAFALLAIPAFDKVKTAYTNVSAAQAAYQKAQLTEKMDPTAANATAVSKALLALRESYKGLDAPERGALHGIQQLMATYHRMAKAFEPDAFKVFNDGLKIANQLLPDVKPFADTFANSLDGLLKQVSKFAQSKGFEDWLKQFHQLEGPAIGAIGHGLGQVGIAFGKLLTIMSKKDVVNSINIAFKILADTIGALGFVIQRIMLRWDQWQQLVRQVGGAMDWFTRRVSSNWDGLMRDAGELAHNIAAHFDEIRHDIAAWADDVGRDAMRVVAWFRQLPGRVMAALASLPGMLFSAGVRAIEGLLSGMKSMVGGAISTVEGWGHDIANAFGAPFGIHFSEPSEATQMVKAGRNIVAGLGTGMLSGTSALHAVAGRVSAAGMPSAGGYGGHGGQIVLEFHVPTALAAQLSPQFWTAFANGVRAKGGSPGIVTRKVSFA